MIFLITGLPGNGKTLYVVSILREAAKERPVFYYGIEDLSDELGWQKLDDPEKWFECPAGSIIVIDECQKIFRIRGRAAAVPDHVSRLETHRHDGHDLYLITQHPNLVDTNLRRLVGAHRHIVRTFGTNRAVVHEWGEVHLDCEIRRSSSSKSTFKYPKSSFGLYKSAEVHTHKRMIPKQVIYILLGLFISSGLLYFVYARFAERIAGTPPPQIDDTPSAPIGPSGPGAVAGGGFTGGFSGGFSGGGGGSAPPPPLTTEEYIAALTPRLPGIPHTAPRYDQVTEPVRAPIVAGCVASATRCQCYTDQATKVTLTPEQCAGMLRHGRPYVDWLPDQQTAQAQAAQGEGGAHARAPSVRTLAQAGAGGGAL